MQPNASAAGTLTVPRPALLRGKHALSLFELTLNTDGGLVSYSQLSTEQFHEMEYSLFKYGRRYNARRYAAALAQLLGYHLHPILGSGEQIVVTGTPHKRLPNAARMLAIETERRLRSAGFNSSYTYIHQHLLAAGDYSKLSGGERDVRNQAKQRSRFVDPADFRGKHVVLVDDVRITGSIERSVVELLASIEVLSLTIINLVKLDPAAAAAQPQIEHLLNHAAVHNIKDIYDLMRVRSDFALTTRAVKYILECEPQDVRWLLKQLEHEQLEELYFGIVDEGYDRMPAYAHSFDIISRKLDR